MIVRVQVNAHEYEVVIEDLAARPVIAVVEGERFEIWPTEPGGERQPAEPPAPQDSSAPDSSPNNSSEAQYGYAKPKARPLPAPTSLPHPAVPATQPIFSPLPGVIVAVSVKPGDPIHAGQQVCVLEAMKMNNSILASHSGTVQHVHIHPGQLVRARQTLVEISI